MEKIAQAVKAAKIFAAKKDVRYYLCGVALYITNNEITSVVSTDGHCCAIIGSEDLQKADQSVIISNKDLDTLYNALLLSSDITVNEHSKMLQVGNYQLPLVDGVYPNVSRVIPKRERDAVNLIGIQPDYLAKLKPFKLELYKHLSPAKRKVIGTRMRVGNESEPVVFEFDDEAIVIIQPIRIQPIRI